MAPTQYNNSAWLSTSKAGWQVSGGGSLTCEGSKDRGHWKVGAGPGRQLKRELGFEQPGPTMPTNTKMTLYGIWIRRNTAAADDIVTIYFRGDDGTYTSLSTYLPVGVWVGIPNMDTPGDSGNWNGEGWVRITVNPWHDDRPIDWSLKNFKVYKTSEVDQLHGAAVIDTNDASFSPTAHPDSLDVSFDWLPNNEAVFTLEWDYGDGSSTDSGTVDFESMRSITHTFPTAGTYPVTLTARNDALQQASTTRNVKVPSGTYQAKMTDSTDYLTVSVDGSSSVGAVIDAYTWDWGDGDTGKGRIATHTYAQSGTYPITLTITNSMGQSSSVTRSVKITAPPDPDIYFTTVADLLSVQFFPSITGGTTYTWNFGDGGTSTDQAPVHVYETPGSYDVTLTVDSLSATQTINVVSEYRPVKNWADALRLEVHVPPGQDSGFNRLPNPNGEQGGYGWDTPAAGATIEGSSTDNGAKDKGISTQKLIYTSGGSGAQTFASEPVNVPPGSWIGAAMTGLYADGYYRFWVECYDVNGDLVQSGAPSGYLGGDGRAYQATHFEVPGTAVKASLVVSFTSDTSNGVPASGRLLIFTRCTLVTASSEDGVTDVVYTESDTWADVLGPTHEIGINREELDVGTLQATILDASLDPSTSDTIRPGQAVRLRAAAADSQGNTLWRSVYTGTINDADVDYEQSSTTTVVVHHPAVTHTVHHPGIIGSAHATPSSGANASLSTRVPVEAVNANTAIQATIKGNGWSLRDGNVPDCTPGKTYQATARVKTTGSAAFKIGVSWMDSNMDGLGTTWDDQTYSGLTDFTDISFSVTAPANAVSFQFINLDGAGGAVDDTVLIDQYALMDGATTVYGNSGVVDSFSGGNVYLDEVSLGSGPSDYDFSAWVKTDGALANTYSMAVEWYGPGEWDFLSGVYDQASFSDEADWAQKSLSAVAPEGATSAIFYVSLLRDGQTGNGTDNFWVDDVSVSEPGGVNLVTNPSFDTDLTGWTFNGSDVVWDDTVGRDSGGWDEVVVDQPAWDETVTLPNDPKKTKITLSASDNITALSSQREPRGVEAIKDLPVILEGKGVPYLVNGSSAQVGSADIVNVNDSATVLDQIGITRDCSLGYAHVDRDNVLVADDPEHMGSVVRGLLDETQYSDVDATFSTSECINSVTIKWLRYDPAANETTEVAYGPYRDEDSILEWGLHPAEFTMQGLIEDAAAIAQRGQDILAANAQPKVRINQVTVPIRYAQDLTTSKALLDLYDLVTVNYDRTGTNDLARVTAISHQITPQKWTMTVGFHGEGTVASPTVPPPQTNTNVVNPFVLMAKATQVLTASGRLQVSATGVSWTERLLCLGMGRNLMAPSGYFDFQMPADGTQIPAYSAGVGESVTVAGGEVPLGDWQALWYQLPLGDLHGGVDGNFLIVGYNVNDGYQVPQNAVLIAMRNADSGLVTWGTGDVIGPMHTITVSDTTNFGDYTSGDPAVWWVRNGMVNLEGIVQCKTAGYIDGTAAREWAAPGTIPDRFLGQGGYYHNHARVFLCQGSGDNHFALTVDTGGSLKISRYGPGGSSTNTWLPFSVCWAI